MYKIVLIPNAVYIVYIEFPVILFDFQVYLTIL